MYLAFNWSRVYPYSESFTLPQNRVSIKAGIALKQCNCEKCDLTVAFHTDLRCSCNIHKVDIFGTFIKLNIDVHQCAKVKLNLVIQISNVIPDTVNGTNGP